MGVRVSAALLTVAEAAQLLRGADGRAESEFVRRLIADGKLEARKEHGRWYVPLPCLEAYLAPRSLKPAGPDFPRRRVGRGARA